MVEQTVHVPAYGHWIPIQVTHDGMGNGIRVDIPGCRKTCGGSGDLTTEETCIVQDSLPRLEGDHA